MKDINEQISVVSNALKALANPIRLTLLTRIAEGDYCVTELQDGLGQSQPSVSQHLGILRERGLITPVRHGSRTCYHLTNQRIRELLSLAKELFGTNGASNE